MTMRDAFFFRLFEHAKKDPSIMVLTSDFSAPSFDRFRTELPSRFINTGISEQNTILVAAGLACSGKNVFVTSIAPFITMRCFEQIRLYAADMNLNIKIVAVGAGYSYNTAGPTHHSIEDIALMRVLPNIQVLMPSCNSQVEAFADYTAALTGPAYVRLDRMPLDELYNGQFSVGDEGFRVLKDSDDIMIVSNGYMIHSVLKTAAGGAGIIDLYRLPAKKEALIRVLGKAKQVITVEEHVFSGGVGAFVCELLMDNNCRVPVKRLALDVSSGFYHLYGTRDEMHESCGIGAKQILESVREFI